MNADFLKRAATHRARLVNEQDFVGPRNAAPAPAIDAPIHRVGDAKPVATKKGLSSAMMRRTVGDVFAAGARLGLPGPLLARHLSSITELTTQVGKTADAVEEAAEQRTPEQGAILRGLPARTLESMTAGLAKLDPATANRVISEVLGTLIAVAGAPKLDAAQARAIECLAFASSQLDGPEMGDAFEATVKAIAGLSDEVVLKAATQTLLDSVATIIASGGATRELFVGVMQAALRALGGDEEQHVVANAISAGLQAGLTDGQVEILAQQATVARQHRDRLNGENAAAQQQIDALKAQLAAPLAPLAALCGRAEAQLSLASQRIFYQQLANAAGAEPKLLESLAVAQLSFLGTGAPTEAAAAQLSALYQQLHGGGVAADSLIALGERRLSIETLSVLQQITARDPALAALSADHLAVLEDSLSGVTQRYLEGDAPALETLVAALQRGLADPDTLAQATQHAARYSVEIPKVEGGPIVAHLRGSFAEDLAAVAHAKLDVAVLDAAWPRLPSDAIARLVAVGVRHGADLDDWLVDLDKYFAAGRGNKDHERNLRSLLVCIDQSGGNPVEFVSVLLASKPRMSDACKLAHYMNVETNFELGPDYVATAVAKLRAKENLLSEIEHRMHGAVMEKLNLGQLLQGAEDVRITDKGLADVQGVLAPLFSSAAGNANVNQDVLKGLLKAALADRVDHYRFETPQTEAHLACLTDEARAKWMEPQVMMHIRFEGDGEKVFHERVQRAALIGGAILERLTESYGLLDELSAKQDGVVDQIRNVDRKADRATWSRLVRELDGIPQRIAALEWATTIANLSPDNITPERFEQLANPIQSLRKLFGPALEDGMEELVWTIRLTGVSYSQVVTDDGPDLPTMYSMTVDRNKTGGGCLNWPGGHGEAMAYWTDPNKRMIITKNAAGQERRVVMRLLERQDEGHLGEPMLIIDKAYPPFDANLEEKRRLIEHLMRRASEMGIACGFASEYYWDASKTSRYSNRANADMNEILIDLCKRYGTEVEKKEMKVLTRMGNTAEEYLDSDPPAGQRGVATVRRWSHNFQQESRVFENEFIVLVPK